MQITRRSFIQTIGSAAAFIAAGNVGSAFAQKKNRKELYPIPVEVYSEPLFSMTAKQLEPFVGRTFTAISNDGSTIQLVLTEVKNLELLGNTTRGYYGDVFSLIFEGSEPDRVTQGVFEMRTDGLPNFPALIVPTGRRRVEYEVVVNHLTS